MISRRKMDTAIKFGFVKHQIRLEFYTLTKIHKPTPVGRQIVGTLRSDDGDGNGKAAKTIGLISKTTILHVHHAFLYISLPSLHDYDVKMPNYTMYRGLTQATTKFPLSF